MGTTDDSGKDIEAGDSAMQAVIPLVVVQPGTSGVSDILFSFRCADFIGYVVIAFVFSNCCRSF